MLLRSCLVLAVAGGAPGGALASGPFGSVAESPVMSAQPLGWGGAYAGGSVGHGRSAVAISISFAESFADSYPNGNGLSAGIFAGYNFEYANGLVAGVEVDVARHRISGDDAMYFPGPGENWTSNLRSSVSLRARLGAEVTHGTLAYIAAGPTTARFNGSRYNDLAGTQLRESYSDTFQGWTLGIGVDRRLNPSSFIRAEIRYNDYGSRAFELSSTVPFTVNLRLRSTEIRLGAGIRF
jgi:outer membrane immunogenic protein